MRTIRRLGAVSLIGLASYTVSSFLVEAASAPDGHQETVGEVPGSARHSEEAGLAPHPPGRKQIVDVHAHFDGRDLAIAGVGLLDNTIGRARDLEWRVQVSCPEPLDPDCEVYFEQAYEHQRFRLSVGAIARPTFADAFVLPDRLPPGRYTVGLALHNARTGERVARTGKLIDVE